MDKEKGIAFYTILLFGLGVIVTLDTSYHITLLDMFIEGVLFCVVMFIVSRIPYFTKKFRVPKPGFKTKKENPYPANRRFGMRAIRFRYKINADAEVINRYLLQHYTDNVYYVTKDDAVTYFIDSIESFDPNKHDVFQYGFIAKGHKEELRPSKQMLAIGETPTSDVISSELPEMFFITISQGQSGISILNFDTDERQLLQFRVGLIQELEKAFEVEVVDRIVN